MNKKELEIMQELYNRIYGMFTSAPAGHDAGFSDETSLLQMALGGIPVNPADFDDQFSPANPKGSMTAAEAFSALVDAKPLPQSVYASSSDRIEAIYGNIIEHANASQAQDDKALAMYNKARNYLMKEIEVEDFLGNKTTQTQNTGIYTAYESNKAKYLKAVSDYNIAYNNYDLSDKADQRKWQAQEPLLRNALEAGYREWRNGNADMVEQAMAAMATSINNAVARIFADEKERFQSSQLASSLGLAGQSWHLSYALPSNWTRNDAPVFTSVKISSDRVKSSSSSKFESYGGKASYSKGIWSLSAGAEHSSEEQNGNLQASSLDMSMDMALIRIIRPWFNSSIFKIHGWTNGAYEKDGSISSGRFDDKNAALPLVPTGMVVIKNLVIRGDFKEEDESFIKKSTSGGADVGIGPFRIGGSYKSGSEKHEFESTYENGELHVPGMQIIGFMSEVIPFSPKAGK